MQTRPTNWASFMAQPHKTEYRYLINDVEYTNSYVQGTPVIEKPLMLEPTIGRCCTGSFNISIRSMPNVTIPKAARVKVACRLRVGDRHTSWVEQGSYRVVKRSTSGSIVDLNCRDDMIMAGQTYLDKTAIVDWPAPMSAVVTEIASLMGVSLDTRNSIKTGNNYKVDYPNEDTLMSEVLSYIAAAHGGNFIMTETGRLRLIPFPTTASSAVYNLNLAYTACVPLSTGNKSVSRITLTDDADNQFTVGNDTGIELAARCDYATQAVVNGLSNIVGRTFYPYKIAGAYLDPCVELGDTIQITYKGSTLRLLANAIKAKCSIGYTCELENGVEDEDEEEYPYVSPQELQAKRFVSTVKTYHGNRINRTEGFVSELMENDSPVARMIANSNMFAMQRKTSTGSWLDVLYFDAVARTYKFLGSVQIESTKADGTVVGFYADENGVRIRNGELNVIRDNAQILLNPELGLVLGAYPVYTESGGTKRINTSNAKFWVNTDGTIYLDGDITATSLNIKIPGRAETDIGDYLDQTDTLTTEIAAVPGEIREAVQSVKVGGRNYLLKSDELIQSDQYLIGWYKVSTPLIAGEEYTISMCVTPSSDITHYSVWLSSGYAMQCRLAVSGTEQQIVSETFTASYSEGRTPTDNPAYAYVYIYRQPRPASGSTVGTATIHWAKVERGNRATDWSPAPEDVDAEIEGVTSELGTLTTRVETAERKITPQAIVDTVTRSETYQNDLDGKVSSETLLNNYSTTTQTADMIDLSVTSEIKSVQLGGTNLIRLIKDDGSSAVSVRYGVVDPGWSDTYYSHSHVGVTLSSFTPSQRYNGVDYLCEFPIEPGSDYMLSFWCWRSGTNIAPTLVPNFYKANETDLTFNDCSFVPPVSTPERFELQLSVSESYTGSSKKAILRFLTFTPWSSGSVYISDVKLERGNKATMWSPAPDDTESELDNIESRVSTAELKITNDAIVSTVTNSTKYKNDLNNKADSSVLTNYSTREQTAESIRDAVGAIDEFHSGSVIAMTKDAVYIGTPDFEVSINDSNQGFHMDDNGAAMQNLSVTQRLFAPNMAEKYAGSASVTIGSNGTYKSLTEFATAINNKVIAGGITATITSDLYESVWLGGFTGIGNIIINGGGHSITGNISIYNAVAGLFFNNLTFIGSVAVSGGLYIGCTSVTFNANGGAVGIYLNNSTTLQLTTCAIYNATHLIESYSGSTLISRNCKGGNSSVCLAAEFTKVLMTGTRPDGNFYLTACLSSPADPSSLTIDYGSATPTVKPTVTVNLSAKNSRTYYPSSWYSSSDKTIRQGYTTLSAGNRELSGCMWFTVPSSVSGKTVKSASLTLTRKSGYGTSSEINVCLYVTPLTSPSGYATSGATNYGIIGTIANGETKEFSIPVAAAQSVVTNGYGLMLQVNDGSLLSNKGYSRNYGLFYGYGESYPPVLTVTYQTT